MKIGAQFYTIRNFCKTTEELERSIDKVADIGYKSIQLSGVCPYDAGVIGDKLKGLGMTVDLTHFDYRKILNETDDVIAFHDRMNCKYIGIGVNPYGATPEGIEKLVGDLKAEVLPKLAASGHKLMYHNHNFEFARFDGKLYLDMLCEAFPPELLGLTLDMYWVQAGGADPVEVIKKYSDYVRCVHLKDMVYDAGDRTIHMAPVGAGNMNYPAILEACKEADVEYAFVEQDDCYAEDPFDCLKQSFEYLTK